MDLQKRKRNYYTNIANNQKKRKQLTMEPGMTGFLCTCNFREKDCVRDAYKILNEFADELYKSNKTKDPESSDLNESTVEENSVSDNEDQDNEEDISSALSKEIDELKAEFSKPASARRFQVVDTGVKNVIFIKTTLPNPLELVTKIVTELDTTKKQRTRFLLRLLPIEAICKAYLNDIKSKADTLLEKYFAQEPKTFCIVFNRHSNNSIHRDDIIQDLAEIIAKKNPGNKADLKNPEIAVVVEVIRGVCLISVAPNYYKFKKYNLLEICNPKGDRSDMKKSSSKDLQEPNTGAGDKNDTEEGKKVIPDEKEEEKKTETESQEVNAD